MTEASNRRENSCHRRMGQAEASHRRSATTSLGAGGMKPGNLPPYLHLGGGDHRTEQKECEKCMFLKLLSPPPAPEKSENPPGNLNSFHNIYPFTVVSIIEVLHRSNITII